MAAFCSALRGLRKGFPFLVMMVSDLLGVVLGTGGYEGEEAKREGLGGVERVRARRVSFRISLGDSFLCLFCCGSWDSGWKVDFEPGYDGIEFAGGDGGDRDAGGVEGTVTRPICSLLNLTSLTILSALLLDSSSPSLPTTLPFPPPPPAPPASLSSIFLGFK